MTMVIRAGVEPSLGLVAGAALAAGAREGRFDRELPFAVERPPRRGAETGPGWQARRCAGREARPGTIRNGFIASAVAALVLSACGQAAPRQETVAVETPGSILIVPEGTPIITPGPPVNPGTQVVLVTPGNPLSTAGPPVATSRIPVPAAPTQLPAAPTPVSTAGVPISATEIVSLLSNRTVYARYTIDTGTLRAGDPWVEYYRPDGQYYYKDQRRSFVGRWSVANGKLCYSENASTACGAVYRAGETIYFTQDSPGTGQGRVVGNSTRIVSGDVERLAGGFGQP
jgi:hypothetical protein